MVLKIGLNIISKVINKRPDIQWGTRFSKVRIPVVCNDPKLIPSKGSDEAHGWDLKVSEMVTLPPRKCIKVPTGVSMEMPKNCGGFIDTRSSSGKRGIDVMCRTIDSDYRGIIHLILLNNSDKEVILEYGERVAQLIFNPYNPWVEMYPVENLGTTKRGKGGFGSTGKF